LRIRLSTSRSGICLKRFTFTSESTRGSENRMSESSGFRPGMGGWLSVSRVLLSESSRKSSEGNSRARNSTRLPFRRIQALKVRKFGEDGRSARRWSLSREDDDDPEIKRSSCSDARAYLDGFDAVWWRLKRPRAASTGAPARINLEKARACVRECTSADARKKRGWKQVRETWKGRPLSLHLCHAKRGSTCPPSYVSFVPHRVRIRDEPLVSPRPNYRITVWPTVRAASLTGSLPRSLNPQRWISDYNPLASSISQQGSKGREAYCGSGIAASMFALETSTRCENDTRASAGARN